MNGSDAGSGILSWAAVLCGLVIAACTPEDENPPVAPDLGGVEAAGATSLGVYGIGDIQRAIPAPCEEAAHRQFDFWLGMWTIENPQGNPAGTSIITSELDGCVVMEDFIGPGGFAGRSLNIYDAGERRWYQRFVDNVVGNFRISGELVGDEMVMTGSHPIFHFPTNSFRDRDTRITWTPNPDGTVRQFIQNSFDGGPVEPGFDGLYMPADELDRAEPSVFPFCQSVLPGARQLDFWLGEWRVGAAPGPELGVSRVTADLNDCLIEENFVGPRGYRSRSFLFYDFVVDRWFRSFADENGMHIELSGGLEDGRMVMTGTETGPNGVLDVRVTLEPVGPDAVRQTWESSEDGGGTWRTELVLDYVPS